MGTFKQNRVWFGSVTAAGLLDQLCSWGGETDNEYLSERSFSLNCKLVTMSILAAFFQCDTGVKNVVVSNSFFRDLGISFWNRVEK